MTKRSIDAFRPRDVPFGERIYSDRDIDRIIAASGGLPKGDVQHSRLADGGQESGCVMVPRPVALAERLETVVKWWQVETAFQQKPTPSQLEERFTSIETAARNLLRALGASNAGDFDEMPPALRFGGLQAHAAIDADQSDASPKATGTGLLDDAVKGVYQLQDWARRAGDRGQTKGGTPRAERSPPAGSRRRRRR